MYKIKLGLIREYEILFVKFYDMILVETECDCNVYVAERSILVLNDNS